MANNLIVKKPSFYSRLSTLFLIQTIFIFIVLALILFYPERAADVDVNLSLLRQDVVGFGMQASSSGIMESSGGIASSDRGAGYSLKTPA